MKDFLCSDVVACVILVVLIIAIIVFSPFLFSFLWNSIFSENFNLFLFGVKNIQYWRSLALCFLIGSFLYRFK